MKKIQSLYAERLRRERGEHAREHDEIGRAVAAGQVVGELCLVLYSDGRFKLHRYGAFKTHPELLDALVLPTADTPRLSN